MLRNKRFYVISGCILTVAALVWRLFQIQYLIEDVGFYKPEYSLKATLAEAGLFTLLAVIILLAAVSMRKISLTAPAPNKIIGIGAGLLALSALPQLVLDYGAAESNSSIFFAVAINAVLAVSFAGIAAGNLCGKKVPFALTVLPVASEFVRLVISYAHFNGIARISENVIYILFLCSFMSFLLVHCRLYSGITTKNVYGLCIGLSVSTAALGISASLPYILLGHNQHVLAPLALGAAIYALVFLFFVKSDYDPCH